MTDRMAKISRILMLVHMLADSSEGLTLDEMARELGLNRRTIERMRDVIAVNFDLEERRDDRQKRFRLTGSLRRTYTRPTAAEVAALQVEVKARELERAPRAPALGSLLQKVKGALDDREKRRLDPDLEALARLQRTRTPAGPAIQVNPAVLAGVQEAILTGECIDFDYLAGGASEPVWRRVAVYGLIHGPVTYLVGKIPTQDRAPVPFRLDRMTDVRSSGLYGVPPDDWNLDAWAAQSFGVWREDDHAVVLRVLPAGADRARTWRFHPSQSIEEDGEDLLIRFRAGGLREIAEHVFTWGSDIVIEEPAALIEIMRERLAACSSTLRPIVSQSSLRAAG